MRGQNLLHNGGFGEKVQRQYGRDPADEAKWQKHVTVALWTLVVLVISVVWALAWFDSHGLFTPTPDGTQPAAAWPVGWP